MGKPTSKIWQDPFYTVQHFQTVGARDAGKSSGTERGPGHIMQLDSPLPGDYIYYPYSGSQHHPGGQLQEGAIRICGLLEVLGPDQIDDGDRENGFSSSSGGLAAHRTKKCLGPGGGLGRP